MKKYLLVLGKFYNDVERPECVFDFKKDAITVLKEWGFKQSPYRYYENEHREQWAKIKEIDYIAHKE